MATVIVTAKAGPSKQMTAVSFLNCRELKLEFNRGLGFAIDENGATHEFALDEINALATVVANNIITTETLT